MVYMEATAYLGKSKFAMRVEVKIKPRFKFRFSIMYVNYVMVEERIG
jgi:hypothetical protein